MLWHHVYLVLTASSGLDRSNLEIKDMITTRDTLASATLLLLIIKTILIIIMPEVS